MKKKYDKKINKTPFLDFSGITPEMQIIKPENYVIYEKTYMKTNDDSNHGQNTATWE